MTIFFLCRRAGVVRELSGYVRAFGRRGVNVACAPDDFPVNGNVQRLIEQSPEKPLLILQPESSYPIFPLGLTEVNLPTACFHFDTYAYTHRRIRWAMLFDHAIVFHPGFEEIFRQAGHPQPLLQPHAVEADLFRNTLPDRDLEVGWVGQVRGPLYRRRARLIPHLGERFKMNDWRQSYGQEEMAEIYKRSKVVVNIAGDKHPERDANLRVFEAMAAGALLFTGLPSELTKLGFRDGEHFIGYEDERTLEDRIRHYLDHEAERRRISDAARELVLREHTYDRRVEEILRMLERGGNNFLAPARSWPEERVRQVYLDYFCAHGRLDLAFEELRRLVVIRPMEAWSAAPKLLGVLKRASRNRWGTQRA